MIVWMSGPIVYGEVAAMAANADWMSSSGIGT